MQVKLLVSFFAVMALVILPQSSFANSPQYAVEGTVLDIDTSLTFDNIPFCQQDGITCTAVDAPDLNATMQCNGGGLNGGWVKSVPEDSQCWQSLTFCYDHGLATQACYVIDKPSDTPALSVNFSSTTGASTYSKCLNTVERNAVIPKSADNYYKEYCIWAFDEGTGLSDADMSGATPGYVEKRSSSTKTKPDGLEIFDNDTGFTGGSDDMFGVAKNGKALVEYLDLGEGDIDGLRLITRSNNVEVDAPLMIPAGPRDTYEDYRNFLKAKPDGVEVKSACYPANAVVACEPLDYKLPGHCGSAALKNFLFGPKDTGASLCQFGIASEVTFKGGNRLAYNWTCE